jgi:DNA gyrase inhibitor GyrI
VTDSYADYQRIIDAHDTLIAWYQRKGGHLAEMKLYGMSEDDPDITPREKCRFDWCIAIADTWQIDAGISERIFPAVQLVSVHAQGDLSLLDRVWRYLWLCWLPNSRYQPANLPALEIYLKSPHEIGWETYDMLCAVPIDPL